MGQDNPSDVALRLFNKLCRGSQGSQTDDFPYGNGRRGSQGGWKMVRKAVRKCQKSTDSSAVRISSKDIPAG